MAPGGAGRHVVGGEFRQTADLLRTPGEQRHGGEHGGQAPGDRGEQVVAASQVRSLMRQDRGELLLVQEGERAAADHDGRRPARYAVCDRARVIEYYRARAREFTS